MLKYYYRNNSFPVIWDNYWGSYRVNSEMAIQIALQQIPGKVVKVELDYEDGVLVYEVYILTTYGLYEVKINANTGQIFEIEKEDD
ncbi:Peptidase propeptide and YPEB domain-containing protein [Desulfonispora thiosulfatigenes DSM 11270]|uniref:Peptidase propeptide and YPEB domain-containing protein n=1 Tax=Desulfonispora thiosulfatigenes DSM 11270 TaxID=656914 RepID=A0A1W1VEZ2_DESTI|nr:PepSY domain-containing protein [Desulfonispora thiosulfatigenes]SMB91793.1 Peptidase propeptide and YPEB domain-containing protein [Desulfonispora thiosulfatigenes DSM 11270]